MAFDHGGILDSVTYAKDAFDQVRRALPLSSSAESQSGAWAPSKTLTDRLDRVALGLERCPRLRVDP